MAGLFIEVLRGYVREGNFTIRDFVAMPNHIHIPMTLPGGLSKGGKTLVEFFDRLAQVAAADDGVGQDPGTAHDGSPGHFAGNGLDQLTTHPIDP
jgi:hypothetical protein